MWSNMWGGSGRLSGNTKKQPCDTKQQEAVLFFPETQESGPSTRRQRINLPKVLRKRDNPREGPTNAIQHPPSALLVAAVVVPHGGDLAVSYRNFNSQKMSN